MNKPVFARTDNADASRTRLIEVITELIVSSPVALCEAEYFSQGQAIAETGAKTGPELGYSPTMADCYDIEYAIEIVDQFQISVEQV